MYWRHRDIQKVIKAAKESGRPLPKSLRDVQPVQAHQKLYLLAFQDCTTCRQVGMGLGPIPWTAVREWCTAARLSEIESDEVWFVVTRIDEAFLKHSAEQMSSGKNTKPVQSRDVASRAGDR